MPDIRSKKSGQQWNKDSFYKYQLEGNPDYKQYTPDQIWQAAQSDPEFEVMTDAPPEQSGFDAGQALSNFPSSFMGQAKQMVTGLKDAFNYAGPYSAFSNDRNITSDIAANPSGVMETAKTIPGAWWQDTKDYWTNPKRIEQDPARGFSDAAMLLGPLAWGSRAAGLARFASGFGKAATVADMASSPVPWVARGIAKVPDITNPIAESAMDYALKFPHKVPLGYRRNLRDLALQWGQWSPTELGAMKAQRKYKQALRDQRGLELNATNAGVDVDTGNIMTSARKDVVRGNRATPAEEAAAVAAVDDILNQPTNVNKQPVISPVRAADIRTRMNEATPPNPASSPVGITVNTPAQNLTAQARTAIGDAVRAELDRVIPGHRAKSLEAMKFHDLEAQADAIARHATGDSIIDHSNVGAMGAAAGHLVKGSLLAPVEMGFLAKKLHAPKHMASLANLLYSKNPGQLKGRMKLFQAPESAGIGGAVKAATRTNDKQKEKRPFDESNSKSNPARPFPED